VNLEQTIHALDALVGSEVQAEVWGLEEDAPPVAYLAGVLRKFSSAVELPVELQDAVGNEAVVFQLGSDLNNHLSLWPDRFVKGNLLGPREGIEICTRDAVVRVRPRSRPWID
jgi:hypothetical protein